MKVVNWRPDDADANERFAEVLARHRESKATLGPMPDAAFRDRARNHGLVIALIGGQVAGYALYDLPRHHMIKLVHLCVGSEHRGAGVAKGLLDFVIAENPNRAAVVAACRKDYGLEGFWRALGMRPASEKPGRAAGGSTLVMWVRQFGAPDMFEDADLNAGLPLAVLDSNIVSGLYSSDPAETIAREVDALESDWVQGSVVFVVSPEVDHDLSKIEDDRERRHQMGLASVLTRLRSARPDDTTLEANLLARIGLDEVHRDKSLKEDVKQIADAIHGRADYFITNDGNLITVTKKWLLADHQLNILRPYELLRALRPESERAGFESKLIDDSDLVWRDAADQDIGDLELTFLDYTSNEKSADFLRALRSVFSRGDRASCEVLFDKRDRSWALLATEISGGGLAVPMLRVVRGQRGDTVAYQLLRHLRKRALVRGLDRVAITDGSLSPTMRAALERDGFAGTPPTATLTPRRQPLAEFLASDLARDLPASPALAVGIAELRHWPLLLTETPLATYVVPIQPVFAEKLFGFSEAMFALRRPRGLGLAREHVYFCSPRSPITSTPGRILWYVSADDSTQIRQLAVRSNLTSSVVMPAEQAFARYGKLGVLGKNEIRDASDARGMVRVVRFQETELLEFPLPRRTLMPLLRRHNVPTNLVTARRADSRLFDEVMALQDTEEEAAE